MAARPGAVALATVLLGLSWLTACGGVTATERTPAAGSPINLDASSQAAIASAGRVAFIAPFSHWDTDWHDTYANYALRSDGNILAAMQLARQDPRYRYTFEQVLFVQHFWDAHPDARQELKHFVQNRQFTFAWGGITQPETSLTAPAVQVRNLQLGQAWIAATFGPDAVAQTAWQSDAFGNAADLPIFLAQSGIPYVFIGRWQHRCDPDYADCTPLPHLFRWSPPDPLNALPGGASSLLVAYLSYPAAWDGIHKLADEADQLKALRAYVEAQFARTKSKYVFIPMGSDFIDPLPNLMSLVDKWNAADSQTKLVVADPLTAFRYIETQDLPAYNVDLNPIWQGFYATRPAAKIADKESEYFLTAADKFGAALGLPGPSSWEGAAISAHYDNIGAVSFNKVWAGSQWPRYQQTLEAGAASLADALARLAARIDAPLVVFNPTSWERSEVIEIQAAASETGVPPGQALSANSRAILVDSVPGTGWLAPAGGTAVPEHPATAAVSAGGITLSNGLASVTLDAAHGGVFSDLRAGEGSVLAAGSDNITVWQDNGDVYGASFGNVVARESDTAASVSLLAGGPLLARAQVTFRIQDQTVTKVITLRADSPRVDVSVTVAALPNTTVVVHSHSRIESTTRTDDLGFAAFTHSIDNRPIQPGDVTYRREIFYPIMYWSSLTEPGGGALALITHGEQGLGGAGDLNLMLSRDARQDAEGVTDADPHTFDYAYWPGQVTAETLARQSYEFNQPLIPVLKSGDSVEVQIPFSGSHTLSGLSQAAPDLPAAQSLLSLQGAMLADIYADGQSLKAVVIDEDPTTPAILQAAGQTLSPPANSLVTISLPANWPALPKAVPASQP